MNNFLGVDIFLTQIQDLLPIGQPLGIYCYSLNIMGCLSFLFCSTTLFIYKKIFYLNRLLIFIKILCENIFF